MLAAFDFQKLFENVSANSSPIVIVLGVLILCFTLFRMSAKRIRQANASRNERLAPEPQRAADAGPRQPMRGDAERLLVELHELGREIEGRIETRIQYLTRLLAEADHTIERMTSAVVAARDRAAGGDDPVKGRILALAREGHDAAEIARRLDWPKGEVELILGLARRTAEEKPPPQNA